MATEIIHTSIFEKSYVLTSEARSIRASTNESHLAVSLSYGDDVFFAVDLYAYNGVVDLFDPGSVIEEYFRNNEIVSGNITVSFGPVSETLRFLYCEYVMPDGFNPESGLLLSSSVRRVHDNSFFSFAALPLKPLTLIDFKAFGVDLNGVPVNASALFHFDADHVPKHTYVFNVANYVKAFLEDNPDMKEVMYFSVSSDGRQMMCYLSPSPAWLTFVFMNIYNVREFIDIEGAVTVKSETSRQTAKCSGDIMQYDRRTDRTYQFTSGPLPADEVESLNQLVSSHSAQLYADGSYYDIVIEDHTCENSTEDDSLSVVKFTWRFKGSRPVKFISTLFGIQPTNRDIFSDEFSPEYE